MISSLFKILFSHPVMIFCTLATSYSVAATTSPLSRTIPESIKRSVRISAVFCTAAQCPITSSGAFHIINRMPHRFVHCPKAFSMTYQGHIYRIGNSHNQPHQESPYGWKHIGGAHMASTRIHVSPKVLINDNLPC